MNTAVIAFRDPITVMHAGATSADVDIGFLMNRANGLLANVAIYWNESGNTFVTAFTSNSGATDSNIVPTSYANFTTGSIYAGKIYTNEGLYWAGNGDVIVTGGGGGSTYSNVNVEAYIGGNIGAYQTYANANIGRLTTSIDSINSNIIAANSAIQTLSANIGTLVAGAPAALDTLSELSNALGNSDSFSSTMVNWLGNITSNITAANSSINSFNANLGAYQTYANANIGALFNGNASTNANLGAYQTWANTNFGTSTYSNTNVEAYIGGNIGAYQTYANATVAQIQANLGAYQTYANADSYFTASTTQPITPEPGDQWYNTTTDILYEFIANYWVDIQSPSVTSNGVSSYGNTQVASYLSTYSGAIGVSLNVGANVTVTGNILPSANITYDLGSNTQRWRDLYLSGSTINLGGATIKTDAASGAIALIPLPTVANPHPIGIVVSPAGTVSTVITIGGTLTENAISQVANVAATTNTTTFGNITSNGNVITSNVYADRFFYSNGAAFSSSNYGNTEVAAYLVANPQGSTYGNTNVEAYLGANLGSATTNITTLFSNAATQATTLNTINANVTAANSAIQTLSANIGTLVAGAPGALDTLLELGNALGNSASFSSTMVNWLGNITSNVTAANTSINTINANIGAFQTFSNSNAAIQATSINSVNANIGAFQTYANVTFNYGNTQVTSYLTSNVSGLVATTSGIQLPSGTTAERPSSPAAGLMRYNTTLSRVEAYMPSAGWSEVVGDAYSIEYLSVAGGGGGGTGGSQDSGGGGGAGGVISGTVTGILQGTTIAITIGGGAAGFTSGGQNGNPGANTTITATGYTFATALKGGYGVGESGNRNGGSGWGSGGGAGGWSGTKGTGTPGQGYDGGATGLAGGGSSGGGGGAGGEGTHNGGIGTVAYSGWGSVTTTGHNVGGTYYFGGGGGGAGDARNASYGGTGGSGGGGAGGWNGAPVNGLANTGGGGGGGTGSSYGPQTSGAGGSGIVILRYQGSQKGTGGTITTAGGYTYHVFTGSGAYSG